MTDICHICKRPFKPGEGYRIIQGGHKVHEAWVLPVCVPPDKCPDVPDEDLRDQLSYCREDWQKVCDVLGEPGEHLDPEEVIKRIRRLKLADALILKLAKEYQDA